MSLSLSLSRFLKRSSISPKVFSRFTTAKLQAPNSVPAYSQLRNTFASTSFYSNRSQNRFFSSESSDPTKQPREAEDVHVVIVGGGPAGLAAAIRLKQNSIKNNTDHRVVVVEKGPELGAHTLSGAVIEPGPLEMLFPNWNELGAPLLQPAVKDEMKFLTKNNAFSVPLPEAMSNTGNYIISLSSLVKWLGAQAEELGVEVYPGFAASELLYNDKSEVIGIATNDMGLDKNFKPKPGFERGIEFHGKITLLAEGCHGSLSKQAIKKYNLREPGKFQTYGLGLKEVWEIDPAKHEPGKIQHTIGYPFDNKTYGGSFLYHMKDNLVSVGIVMGLDYSNPYISPYQEFQRFKMHPYIRNFLEGGKVISYGARSLVEGGLQSLPKLVFPGGALLGDSAGLINLPKIKGTHNAILSGILAADSISKSFDTPNSEEQGQILLDDYQTTFESSPIYKELYEVRNIRPSFHSALGTIGGVIYSGIETMFLKGRTPYTLQHKQPDYASTKTKAESTPIEYPKPDGIVSFDILTSVSRTGTNHAENQPVHLRVSDLKENPTRNYEKYAAIEQNFCPAGVYEYVDDETNPGKKRFQINSQNCIHCKTCDIKDPEQKINWTVPEGGG
ncbi:hypothetical protein BB560_004168, partial [Smittium megazygosporum]